MKRGPKRKWKREGWRKVGPEWPLQGGRGGVGKVHARTQGMSDTAGCRAGKNRLGTRGIDKAGKEGRGKADTQVTFPGSNFLP